MRKIAFLSLGLLAFSLVGCDNKIPMEENLYPESVYLVGANKYSVIQYFFLLRKIQSVYNGSINN